MNQSLTRSSQNSSKKPLARVPDSFVEALKDIGANTAHTVKSNAAAAGRNILDQFTSRLADTQQPFPSTPDVMPWQRQLEEERRLRLEQQRIFEQKRRQDHLIFSQKELSRQQEIKALQQQLQQLVEETQDLGQEIEIAVQQQIVNPGTYHVNFFEKLRQFIKLMRQKIHDSATWLAAFNHRAHAKGYWGQVTTSGTKFMLSQERYMVTQTG